MEQLKISFGKERDDRRINAPLGSIVTKGPRQLWTPPITIPAKRPHLRYSRNIPKIFTLAKITLNGEILRAYYRDNNQWRMMKDDKKQKGKDRTGF